MFTTTFGVKLKEIRKEKGVRQNDLAQKVNITQASISQIERGERVPTPALIRKFAEALDVDIDSFSENDQKAELQVLLRNAEKLSSDSLRKLNERIEELIK